VDILIDFDLNNNQYQAKESKDKPRSIFAAQQHEFAEGLSGRAIDFSVDAAFRMPLKLKEEVQFSYGADQSFAVQVWVKTLPNAPQGTFIAGNKKDKNEANPGWLIMSDDDGGWSFAISDGKKQYIYQPTVERQRINDGIWHQLVFSVNREKSEVWLYFDGVNVGIYNTPGLKILESDYITTFGGTASNWDYYGQLEAFNGFMDNIKLWKKHVSSTDVKTLFTQYYPMQEQVSYSKQEVKVLSWNIWGGGRELGKNVGVQRVIESIKATNADVVTLIETYGSGEIIADSLGYYFYLISSNLSIMSRYPIVETIDAFKPFNFGGAKLQLSDEQQLVVFDTWLHYLPDYRGNIIKGEMTSDQLVKDEEKTRLAEIKQILKEVQPWIKDANNIPVIMAGDFNTNSHFDWTALTKDIHLGYVVDWPVTKEMDKAGFIDSFREINPNPLKDPGFTGWPYNRDTEERDVESRIDYIFYQGKALQAIESKVVNYHPVMFPSDHSFVLSTFKMKLPQ